MSATATTAHPGHQGSDVADASGSGLADPADRGTLSVADHVVERVAGYAVTLIPHAVAAPRRVLGMNLGDSRPDSAAQVNAQVHGSTASVEATIAVRWPHSVREVTDQVRQRIRDDVAAMTAVNVDHVDIEVVSMSVSTRAKRRVQ
jgi:uncharacterized alkaline shock family protein YloU